MSLGLLAYGTWSSNGTITTTTANYDVTFDGLELNSLTITAVDADITVKVNGEAYYHSVDSGTAIIFDGVLINKLTIIESGVTVKLAGTRS